jgi:hypothetical protein
MSRIVLLTYVLMVCNVLLAQAGTDRWAGLWQNSEMTVHLMQQADGYSGKITIGTNSLSIGGRLNGSLLEGNIATGDRRFPFQATLTNQTLTLVTMGASYTLEKRAPAPQQAAPGATAPRAAAPAAGLVGEWRSPTGTVRLNADGTAVFNGSPGRYAIENATLVLSGADGVFRFPFTLSGDVLTLSGNGQSVQLTRIQAEAAVAAGSSSTGSVRQELAGKWCYIANVNATGGGARTSSTCVTLNPDGTYQYHGLTDSYGPNGGATSQIDDTGTWTATATSLTANSRLRGQAVTYRLEKRNHPKTNDPMLILNGQAFVTFFQKNPW